MSKVQPKPRPGAASSSYRGCLRALSSCRRCILQSQCYKDLLFVTPPFSPCFSFPLITPLPSVSVTYAKALAMASLPTATVQAPTPQPSPRPRFGPLHWLLVPWHSSRPLPPPLRPVIAWRESRLSQVCRWFNFSRACHHMQIFPPLSPVACQPSFLPEIFFRAHRQLSALFSGLVAGHTFLHVSILCCDVSSCVLFSFFRYNTGHFTLK